MAALFSFLFVLSLQASPGWTTVGEKGFCQVYDIQSVSDGLLIEPQYFDTRVGYQSEENYHLASSHSRYSEFSEKLTDALSLCKQVKFYLVDNGVGCPSIDDIVVRDKTLFYDDWTDSTLDHVPGTVLSYKDPDIDSGRTWDHPDYPEILKMDGYILGAFKNYNSFYGAEDVSAIARSPGGGIWTVINHFTDVAWGCQLFPVNDDVYAVYLKRPLTGTLSTNLVIRKSTDGGFTWTEPSSSQTGLFPSGCYVVGGASYVVRDGRIYLAVMDYDSGDTEYSYNSLGISADLQYSWISIRVMSASVNDDLLDVDSWDFSNPLEIDDYRQFHPRYDTSRVIEPTGGTNYDGSVFVNYGTIAGWLEPTIVYDEGNDEVAVLVRVQENPVRVQTSSNGDVTHWVGGVAGKLVYNDSTETLSFDKFVNLPGGSKRFSVVYDDQTRKYYTLANWWPDRWKATKTNASGDLMVESMTRSVQALAESPNLEDWSIKSVPLYTTVYRTRGFQYVDLEIDGDDLIAMSRTAFTDGEKEAESMHDNNMITFHRFENFRSLEVDDSRFGNADNSLIREYNQPDDVVYYNDFDHYTNSTSLTDIPGWTARTGDPIISEGVLKYGNSKSEFDFTETYALDDSTAVDHNVNELWIRIHGKFSGDGDGATLRLGLGNSTVTDTDDFGRYGGIHLKSDSDLSNLVELKAISQNSTGALAQPANDGFVDIYCKLSNDASDNLSVQVWYNPSDPANLGVPVSSQTQAYNTTYGGRVIDRVELNSWGVTGGCEHEIDEVAVGTSVEAVMSESVFDVDFSDCTNLTPLSAVDGGVFGSWSVSSGNPTVQDGVLCYGNSKSAFTLNRTYALDQSTEADFYVPELWFRVRAEFPGDSDEAVIRMGLGNSSTDVSVHGGKYGGIHVIADSDESNLAEFKAISQGSTGANATAVRSGPVDIYCRLSNDSSGNLKVETWYDPADPQNPGSPSSSSTHAYDATYGGRVIDRFELNAWYSSVAHEIHEIAVASTLSGVLP